MKRIILKEGTEKELEKLVKESDKALSGMDKELQNIKKIIRGLDLHSKVFVLNELIARLISYSSLSPFVIVSILEGIKHVMQSPIPQPKKMVDLANYVG